jgi:hypothetical protein
MKNGEDGMTQCWTVEAYEARGDTPKPGASGGCSFRESMPTMCTTWEKRNYPICGGVSPCHHLAMWKAHCTISNLKPRKRRCKMITRTIMASDGVNRTVEGKIFDDQLRIYRVFGDVTNLDALKETAQILALQTNVSEVVYTNI